VEKSGEILEVEIKFRKQAARSSMLFLFILFLGLVVNCGYTLFPKWQIDPQNGITVTVRRGMTLVRIAHLLNEEKIIHNTSGFIWAAKLLGVSRHLQAGKYSFQGRVNNYHILKMMAEGDVVTETITFFEGIRATQIAAILEAKMGIPADEFMKRVMDTVFVRSLGITSDSFEGYLFPDTYQFHTDATPDEIIIKMCDRFNTQFTDSLRMIASNMGFTKHDIVTLASIVEGEAIIDSERPVIAAIYINRLKKGMALQACPTVQYLLPEGPRRLLKTDLEIDSPYNTYKYRGLPPGPVNNPGMKSILSVLNPANVNYLYLVANGDGSHTFSKNMDDHLKAKRHLDRIRLHYRH
jgi:UPF0755 protein